MLSKVLKLRGGIRELRWRAHRARWAFKLSNPLILNPEYAEDGIITNHIAYFLKDPNFLSAYRAAKETGALLNHRGDIRWRTYINISFAKYALKVKGDFVDCGVGKGLYSKAICEYLNFQSLDRSFHLIDTFSGIPISQLHESEINTGQKFNSLAYKGSYLEEVKDTFRVYRNVEIHQGQLPGILNEISFPKGISYLQIDLNNANAELATLDKLLSHCNPGGVIILDDFAYGREFELSYKLITDFANYKNLNIITIPTGQGLILI